MLGLIARILKVLNSETDPGQIGAAVAFACLLGFTPVWTLHNLAVLLLVLVLRANLSIFMVAWGVFTLLAFGLDPVFDAVGHAVLTAGALQPMWSGFHATDLGRLSEFNNTVVMGSLIIGLITAPVLWYATVWNVRNYRLHMLAWLRRKRAFQLLAGTRLFELYNSLAR